MADQMKLGVLTGGGDCPGLNAVIRAVVKTAINDYDMEVVGFQDGYEGLIENRYRTLKASDVSGILTLGGTILGTSNRADPFHYPVLQGDEYIYLDRSSQALQNFERLGLDALIAIGGDGTMAASNGMTEKGLNIIGVPKTIDNDLWGTDQTFGFDSAVTSATEAIDKIHTTAQSHHRVMIVEVMGRYAGWLALASGVAGGGDIILIPEIPYQLDVVVDKIRSRNRRGRNFSIVVIGEGAKSEGGDMVVKKIIENSPDQIRLGGISNQLAAQIEGVANIETRVTILGHLLRGGTPTAFDRLLATQFGCEAVHLAYNKKFGQMVALKGGNIESVPITEVAGKIRKVCHDTPLLKAALSLDTSLGVDNTDILKAEKALA
ncbi:MAG: 6-phosphofructokinase [Candidatus Zixiibacteriota bacterium]|nr:MAG: 6-phosphofructokinase [candidate division Zixibacteria bacterium]HDL03703.1 ATP-dependent 6-phosphofructokinase [candidate division Zixibacteria bacterium]